MRGIYLYLRNLIPHCDSRSGGPIVCVHCPDVGKGASEVIEFTGKRCDERIGRLAGSRRCRPPIEVEHALMVPVGGAMQANRIAAELGGWACARDTVCLIRGCRIAGASDDPLPGPLQLPDLNAGEDALAVTRAASARESPVAVCW